MLSLREQNKQEKRRRIIEATVSLLAEKGYEQTTTKEIAERAGVAAGTIFLYAHDKLDLFLMSITENLDTLTERTFEKVDDDKGLEDQVVAFFRPRFEFWARWPELSRIATHQMAAVFSPDDASPELARGIRRRAQTLAKLRELLRRAEAKGQLRGGVDIDTVAEVILYLYIAELRFWLCADAPRPAAAVKGLRKLVAVVIDGILRNRD